MKTIVLIFFVGMLSSSVSKGNDKSYNFDLYEQIAKTDTIQFPNAFIPSTLGPNGGTYDAIDYRNEVFHPISEGVTEYRLLIYNKLGLLMFESNDIMIGWDGYFKGTLCGQDVYVWKATGVFSNGKKFSKKGNVTLIR